MATGYHSDKLWMAFLRKLANCDDFHSLTASVHMSTWRPPCGITICNSKLLWLLELETVPGQAFWQGKFHWWEPWQESKSLSLSDPKREEFAKLSQRNCDVFSLFSFWGEVVLQEATIFMDHLVLNTSIPMCHLCFSPGRDEIPESVRETGMGEKMSLQCFASVDLNIIRFFRMSAEPYCNTELCVRLCKQHCQETLPKVFRYLPSYWYWVLICRSWYNVGWP